MLTTEDVEVLAEAGGAAPSGGNMQAWRLVATKAELALHLDRERSGSFIDVGRLGSMLGLGSFTENVCLAALARGLEHVVSLEGFTDLDSPLVRIAFTGRGAPNASPEHDVIFDRSTNRQPGDGTRIADPDIEALRAAAASLGDGYVLVAIGDPEERSLVAAALGEADVVRTFNHDFHTQMLSEMRWTNEEASETRDGVDVATLELGASLTGLRLMRHRLFVALMVSRKRIRSMTETALAASSHLCALSMPKEATPEQLVIAGRALERVWLSATVRGLALQPWSVIPFFALRAEREPRSLGERDREQIADIDRRLRALWQVGEGSRIIFVFRLSKALPPSTRALRRNWTDFTTMEGLGD